MAKTLEEIQIPDDVKAAWIKLSVQHRQFILNYLADPSDASQAYLDAGYSVTDKLVASAAASRLLKGVTTTTILYGILKANRLTPEYADLKHFELLEATETKFFAHEGQVIETQKVAALPIRLQALDMLHKIHRRYGKVNGNGNGNGETHYHFTVNLQGSEQELASGLLAEIRKRPALPADHAA